MTPRTTSIESMRARVLARVRASSAATRPVIPEIVAPTMCSGKCVGMYLRDSRERSQKPAEHAAPRSSAQQGAPSGGCQDLLTMRVPGRTRDLVASRDLARGARCLSLRSRTDNVRMEFNPGSLVRSRDDLVWNGACPPAGIAGCRRVMLHRCASLLAFTAELPESHLTPLVDS